jgi:hypothetical protein
MGALTVQKIADRVRRQFGDANASIITDQAMFDWINDAMREIVLANNLLAIKATSATVAGTSSYNIPADLLSLHHVSYKGEPLEETSVQAAQDTIESMDDAAKYPTGIPSMYWMYGTQIFLYPSPNTSGAADLTIYYNRNPVEVAAVGATPELPARYDNRIIEYCLAMAAEIDEDDSKYQLKKAEFKQGVSETSDEEEGPNNLYPFVGVSSADGGGSFYWDI